MKKLIFAVFLLSTAASAQSPFDGTWRLDLDTIQYPDKPIVSLLQNDIYQNQSAVPKVNIKADGTDQRVAGARDYDTLAVTIVDPNTVKFIAKKGGKVVESTMVTVSADGKTSTAAYTQYPMASKDPVTGKAISIRVAPGPVGSHAISGAWRIQKETASENALTFTVTSSADGMMLSMPTGESFDAKFDGKDYPMKGAAADTTVSLKKMADRYIISTVKRDGKIVAVYHQTLSPDGKTQSLKTENKEQGTTTTLTAIKQ